MIPAEGQGEGPGESPVESTIPPGLRERLVAELEALRAASDASADDRRPVALDQQSVGRLSRMDALQVQAMAQASERRRTERARRLEAAIARIDAGDYGYCVRCDEPIAPARLEADPTLPTCIHCAAGG